VYALAVRGLVNIRMDTRENELRALPSTKGGDSEQNSVRLDAANLNWGIKTPSLCTNSTKLWMI